ncbi:MAG: glycosyl hydrolase family 18 protein [bacterium]|nr:glycosyl hydrolase family 18 protein [bacterium]
MLKKISVIIVLLICIAIATLLLIKTPAQRPQSLSLSPTPTSFSLSPTVPVEKTSTLTKSIFIPYWATPMKEEDLNPYDELLYFGIEVSPQGVLQNETGYKNLSAFSDLTLPSATKLLVVRMIDTNTNNQILHNKQSWETIANDVVRLASEKGFQGVVLDLEMSGITLIDVSGDINQFVQNMSTTVKGRKLTFSMTMYGDVFYRKRPYDVRTLASYSDKMYIMAYDFHKSLGEPGPNFQYDKGDRYPYDFKTMVTDFSQVVPSDKLVVIFGMYGYDWSVDEKKRPIRTAKSLSLSDIKKEFVNECKWQDCILTRDSLSRETEVNYVTSEIKDNFATIYYHVVWFEDEESVRIKTEYLKEHRIEQIAYWTYGYF